MYCRPYTSRLEIIIYFYQHEIVKEFILGIYQPSLLAVRRNNSRIINKRPGNTTLYVAGRVKM